MTTNEKTTASKPCGCGSPLPATHSGKDAGCEDCGTVYAERNHYFTGKFMTARDSTAEQKYLISHRHAHNRHFHGWGVLCGLEVEFRKPLDKDEQHDGLNRHDRCLKINCGIALDCCGREIYVNETRYIDLPLPPKQPTVTSPMSSPSDRVQHSPLSPPQDEGMRENFIVGLIYKEIPIDYVPALYADNNCDPTECQPNRIRETYEIVYVPLSQLPGCWKTHDPIKNVDCKDDDSDKKHDKHECSCFDGSCVCGDIVPLALIEVKLSSYSGEFEGWKFDMSGRHKLPPPPELLTHIRAINWNHGGTTYIRSLPQNTRDDRQGLLLEIAFDGKLKRDGLKTGVNKFTLLLEYEAQNGDRRPVFKTDERNVFVDDDGHCTVARFLVLKDALDGYDELRGARFYVTLKCDFILDCNGNAVDGNFLGGSLPTGDGIPGGTFESWVYLKGKLPDGWSEQRYEDPERDNAAYPDQSS